ncbi:YybH family protein [Parablastomonas sp. CN1-191]|uniref:YybH family protein n=1 Tax=Parablastomonas sp. CN1-191 TaxID=3400908 RepID=UPI003BF8495E
MKIRLAMLAAAIAVQPVGAAAHAPGPPKVAAPTPGNVRDRELSAVRDVLARNQAAIERLDASGTGVLFAPDSAIFETGGSEGTYANYLAHHLTPELAEFKSFKFSNYAVDVRFEGPLALASETYKYRIVTKEGAVAERLGVATSVLKKIGGAWKILVSHNSGRKPTGG